MLLKITRQCTMGCTHCLEEASIDGEHMTRDVFYKALDFLKEMNPVVVLVTGGEPTGHPGFFKIMNELIKVFGKERLIITSNGLFLYNKAFTDRVLALGVMIQVTNDVRYYPFSINMDVKHKLISYTTHIQSMYPLGRAVENGYEAIGATVPRCFNLRSIACNNADSLKDTIKILESKAKFCQPSVGVDGSVYAGESSLCYKIGTIEMTDTEIMKNIRNTSCNKCGLEETMPLQYKRHINLR